MQGEELNIIKAFEFAFLKHQGSLRKGSSTPYIVHPIEVAIVLMKAGVSETMVIAGLLHDLMEDENVQYEELMDLFGIEVADLVKIVSEPEKLRKTQKDPKSTWKQRKFDNINQISQTDHNGKLLACADKLVNIRDMINDYTVLGEKLWNRFNAEKAEQEWYYRTMCKTFSRGKYSIADHPIYLQFKNLVKQLFG
ncbi:MAG: HD domain-containing protein [Candidatus Hodarchaeota archaeon]